jgi:glycosyltransferase involved in cell wall biosynthesis
MNKIVVITPIKNEEWILDQFLSICSTFADHILIADQKSSDSSVAIMTRHEKVTIINNENEKYDEASRQTLLITKARELFGPDNLLVAIDADEILNADALDSANWMMMRNAEPGTTFFFEKPTIFFDTQQVIRYPEPGWPLAYKDDGIAHQPTLIHSTRIPIGIPSKQIYVEDIKFIHLCFVRKNITFSKNRYYCLVESISKKSSLRLRVLRYNYYKPEDYLDGNHLEPTQNQWFDYWTSKGINILTFAQKKYYWTDYESLRIFHKHGINKFRYEPVWSFDWERCRQAAIAEGEEGIYSFPIPAPNPIRLILNSILYKTLIALTQLNRLKPMQIMKSNFYKK